MRPGASGSSRKRRCEIEPAVVTALIASLTSIVVAITTAVLTPNISAQHSPQHQQRGPRDCEETAHGQHERFEVVAHSPPALCRAKAVALSAMILTMAAATAG